MCHQFVCFMLEDDNVPYELIQGRQKYVRRSAAPFRTLYQQLKMSTGWDFSSFASSAAMHKLHPYVDLFVETLQKDLWDAMRNDDGLAVNQALRRFRKYARSDIVRRQVANHERKVRKQVEGRLLYVEKLFTIEPYLTVVYLQFANRPDPGASNTQDVSPAAQLRSQFNAFVKHRTRVLPTSVGYVTKISHRLDAGFYLDVMFFFCASELRHGVELAEVIGRQWVAETITGTFCGANAMSVANSAPWARRLGRIASSDTSTRGLVVDLAECFVSTDFYLRSSVPDSIRVHTRCPLPAR